MPQFTYKAKNLDTKMFSGRLEARDEPDAIIRLRERGLFTINIKEKPLKTRHYVMKSKQLSEFCKELSLMLRSGLPLVKALGIISTNESVDKRIKAVYTELHRSIKNGVSLSEAMRSLGKSFPDLIINMIYSGEVSGTLAEVADKMADYYISDYKLRKKISSATMYPRILMLMVVVVLMIVFLFVMPNILGMLQGQELPAITQFMKNISDYVVNKWYNVLMYGFALIVVFTYLKSVKTVRYHWHWLILRINKIGPLLRIIYTARFARTLSSLYSSGVQLVTALGVSSKIIGNTYVEGQFPEIIKKIKQGEAMSTVISEADGFSGKLHNILLIGEETGRLDDILDFAAGSFEYDADVAISSLLSILEPLMLVIVAIIIGLVVVSVLLPIFQMYDTVGSGGL